MPQPLPIVLLDLAAKKAEEIYNAVDEEPKTDGVETQNQPVLESKKFDKKYKPIVSMKDESLGMRSVE